MKYRTKWESDKIKKHHTQESQKVSTFPAGDLNAARNRQNRCKQKYVLIQVMDDLYRYTYL